MKRVLLLLCLSTMFTSLSALPIQRRILAFWDSDVDIIVEDSLVHTTMEMPLNFLGLDVIYQDIHTPLPSLSKEDEIRGILICFKNETTMKNPEEFIQWAIHAIDLGKKVVLMKNIGFLVNPKGHYTPGNIQNRLFEKLGFISSQQWISYPIDYTVLMSSEELIPFEKPLPSPLPGFYQTRVHDSNIQSFLKVGISGKPESAVDLVIVGPNGGYISEFYDNFFDSKLLDTSPRLMGWYINPFRFFAISFGLSDFPIADPTTLAGRRIFIATCHGDEWNGVTSMEEYRGKDVYNAEVILEKVIKPFPNIPVAIGLVAADFDPQWASRNRSQATAKHYSELPQVEVASHTYSHPFDWDFFHTDADDKELDFLSFYPFGSWQKSFKSWCYAKIYQIFRPKKFAEKLKWGYFLPRAYANEKFDINQEITGSINYLNGLLNKDRKIELLIWPGDSRPWDSPVRLCEEMGVKHFGGGFVQFDAQHPSTLFVYPLCRKPGGFIQLYASANAENAYTNSWKDHFYRFAFLKDTLKNTESPRRLKPIHLYYHSYSGEFESSVNAILSNIAFIQTQETIPLQVNRYCEIGQGFFSINIEEVEKNAWKMSNRQGLQTIRFDKLNHHVDFSHSKGIIGYREYQGSLYTYLDAAVDEPVLALYSNLEKNINRKDIDLPSSNLASYLIDSNWEIWNLERKEQTLSFNARGWGPLSMRWKVPLGSTYKILTENLSEQLVESREGILEVILNLPNNIQTQIRMNQQ